MKRKIKVACILDTFSYECLKYECNMLYLNKSSWKEQLEAFNPEFLLVESFWEGIDSSWKAELVYVDKNQNSQLLMLLNYCEKTDIKTVFWNKEDPPNFNAFIEIAKKFEYIFTTDSDCVKKYKSLVPHNNIFVLPFAAQPKLHNPINKKSNNKIAFAGSWYEKKHFLRQTEMGYLLDGVKEITELNIYDRNYNNGKNNFPEKYHSNILGGLEYSKMVEQYKEYSIFLNTNIVFYSKTMFSRRVFEILACGTNIVSSYALGVQNYFQNIVPLVSNKAEATAVTENIINNKKLSDKLSVLGIREIYNKHLYEHRFNYMLEKLNINVSQESKPIYFVAICNNSKELNLIINIYNKLKYDEKSLILICDKKYKLNLDSDILRYEKFQDFINSFRSGWIFNLNPLSFYAEDYLIDYLHAMKYTDAEVIGKATYYSESENGKVINTSMENQYVSYDKLNPSTLCFKVNEGTKSNIIKFFNMQNFGNINAYSINRFEFAEKMSNAQSIDEEIIANKLELLTYDNTPRNYKRQLIKSTFSKDYKGINQLFGERVFNKSGRIVIFGAGEHTEKFLSVIDNSKYNFVGITDSNSNLYGTKKYGFLIESLQYWDLKAGDSIYVSSKGFEDEITAKLKANLKNDINIINLYNLNPTIKDDIFKELYLENIEFD